MKLEPINYETSWFYILGFSEMATGQRKVALFLCVVFSILRVLCTTVVTGGITKIEKQDLLAHKDLLDGLNLAVRVQNAQEPKPPFKFVFLPYTLQASSQVVEGTLYRATVKLVPSKCKNDLNETREGFEACGVDLVNPEVLRQEKCCEFEIWSRPWLPEKERLIIQKQECKPSSVDGTAQSCPFRLTMKFNFTLHYNQPQG